MTRFVGRWSSTDKTQSSLKVSELVPVRYSRPMTAGTTERDEFYGSNPPHGAVPHRLDSGSMAVCYDDTSGGGWNGAPLGRKWVHLRDSRYMSRLAITSMSVPHGVLTWFDLSAIEARGFTWSHPRCTVQLEGFWMISLYVQADRIPSFGSRSFLRIGTSRVLNRKSFNGDNAVSYSVVNNLASGGYFDCGIFQTSGATMSVHATVQVAFLGQRVGQEAL